MEISFLTCRLGATSGRILVKGGMSSIRTFARCVTPPRGPCPKQGKAFEPKTCKKRGKLPWETFDDQVEECLNRKVPPWDCPDCIPPEVKDRITMNRCQQRRFEKCMKKKKNRDECMELMEAKITEKEYPMIHAVQKKYLPGCPMAGWNRLNNQPPSECC
nr:unnamed protein product [Callosobruchus chinensis]